jgi:hypothetical protein
VTRIGFSRGAVFAERWPSVCRQFCGSPEEFEAVHARLKTTACPHCKRVGTLIRHGFLRGYDEQHRREKAIRAWRIFCNNRRQSSGCGRTFSVWTADKIQRLFLTAGALWTFLKQAVVSGNKLQAFRDLKSGLSDSAPYRIWKRFREAQSAIRAALGRLGIPPPQIASGQPAEQTLAHLETALGHPHSPIAAFQVTLQTSFV